MQLTAIDWSIIVGYFLLTIAIGILFSRRAGKSLSEFFVSGRSLPWWIAGTSMVATTFAADTPLAVTGLVVKNGLAGNWFWWAFAVGGMFTVFVFSRMWRRAGVMTDVELIRIRYGGAPATWLRVFRAVYVAAVINPIIIGWVVGAMLKVLQHTVFFDLTSEVWDANTLGWVTVIGMMVVVGVYSTLSGMWGVALSDVIQFVMAMTGCVWLAWVAVDHIGGTDQVAAKVEAAFGSSEPLHFLPDFTAESAWLPLHIFLIMVTMQWWVTWYPGAEPGGGGYVVQRMASCKDERHSLLATLWFQIAHYCIRPWPWIMISFAALVLFPDLRANHLADANFDVDIGFPMVMRKLCGPGLAGLMLVAFFAAFMSTMSTQMNWGASYLVRDFIQPVFLPNADDQQLLRWSRVISVLVLVEGLAAGFLMNQLGISVDEAWKLLAALGAGTGLVFMLRWFWWRINAWSEISAMIASLCFFVFWKFAPVQLSLFGRELKAEEHMVVVAACTTVVWVVTTLMTRPETESTLESFYSLVRPGGPGWKKVAEKLPNIQADQDLGIAILGAIAASGVVYFTIPLIGSLIFGWWTHAIICIVGAAVCAVVVAVVVKKMTTSRQPAR